MNELATRHSVPNAYIRSPLVSPFPSLSAKDRLAMVVTILHVDSTRE